jgi:hypothetical protein
MGTGAIEVKVDGERTTEGRKQKIGDRRPNCAIVGLGYRPPTVMESTLMWGCPTVT